MFEIKKTFEIHHEDGEFYWKIFMTDESTVKIEYRETSGNFVVNHEFGIDSARILLNPDIINELESQSF